MYTPCAKYDFGARGMRALPRFVSFASSKFLAGSLDSGSCRCALIGVPCRLSMLSTFIIFADVLFQDKSPRAEGAKIDPPPGYTYEGTQTTA